MRVYALIDDISTGKRRSMALGDYNACQKYWIVIRNFSLLKNANTTIISLFHPFTKVKTDV